MALNIKDTETEKLAVEVAEMTGETKTGALREALREKKERLGQRAGDARGKPKQGLREYLETEIWPQIPDELLDREPMSKEEVENILGLPPASSRCVAEKSSRSFLRIGKSRSSPLIAAIG